MSISFTPEQQAYFMSTISTTVAQALQATNEKITILEMQLKESRTIQAQLLEEVTHLRTNAERPQPPVEKSAPTIKLAKPMEFTGEKNTIDIETFILQCALYLEQYPEIPNNQAINFVISFMKGSAARWAQAYKKQELDESWKEFLRKLKGMPHVGRSRSRRKSHKRTRNLAHGNWQCPRICRHIQAEGCLLPLLRL
jgi:hypothetical protein